MEFHPPLVGLPDGVLHGIPHRRRCLATFAGEPCAPGFEFRPIDGVGCGAHLKDNGIAPGSGKFVELVADICLGLLRALVLPLVLTYHMEPRAAEFPFGIPFRRRHGSGSCRCHDREYGQNRAQYFFHSMIDILNKRYFLYCIVVSKLFFPSIPIPKSAKS